jgi:hypothetical protein
VSTKCIAEWAVPPLEKSGFSGARVHGLGQQEPPCGLKYARDKLKEFALAIRFQVMNEADAGHEVEPIPTLSQEGKHVLMLQYRMAESDDLKLAVGLVEHSAAVIDELAMLEVRPES